MSDSKQDLPLTFAFLMFLILSSVTGRITAGNSLDSDKQVLLELKFFLEQQNTINPGTYLKWDSPELSPSPCNWPGVSCSMAGRVTGISLSNNDIAGNMFTNFSALTQLTYLDLSLNTITDFIPDDLNSCHNLKALNLSHNVIVGQVNLTGLQKLEVLDLSGNRITSDIQSSLSGICSSLVVANFSANNISGELGNFLNECQNLQYVDLSFNMLSGDLLLDIGRLTEFSVSRNNLGDKVSPLIFPTNCSLQVLDISENSFMGQIPAEISNCKDLNTLNLGDNRFKGNIPQEVGSISTLQQLFLNNNNLSREIPESLLSLTNLENLDLSKNSFGGDVQEIFGRFTQLKSLDLHDNSYTGGIESSGIFKLPNISMLDLSYNSFSGPIPIGISEMMSLKYLILAFNQFTGNISPEFGNLSGLQALDLSFNKLNGPLPSSLGNLKSLLWLILSDNSLTGNIPRELGNCNSLLWLNLANNQISGTIPPHMTNIGKNPTSIFKLNQRSIGSDSGIRSCLVIRRWIPMDYPPFGFVNTTLTRSSCQRIINQLLSGYSIFPFCVPGSSTWTYQVSGYLQLGGNKLSGLIPQEIGSMKNFSILQLGANRLYGILPPEIGLMSLIVLNISRNIFSGEIPGDLGKLKCLQSLDLSFNNFSGPFPSKFLNNLSGLSNFNVSYNPYVSGIVPPTGQLATFDKWSYVGDPLLRLPVFIDNTSPVDIGEPREPPANGSNRDSFSHSFAISASVFFAVFFVVSFWLVTRSGLSDRFLQKIVGEDYFPKTKLG